MSLATYVVLFSLYCDYKWYFLRSRLELDDTKARSFEALNDVERDHYYKREF